MVNGIKRPLAWLASVAVAFAALNAFRTGAQGRDDLFDGHTLQRLDLTINSRDWEALRDDRAARSWYPATLKWREIVAPSVGIRAGGGAGPRTRKPCLEVDASWSVSGGSVLGLQRLTLDNLDQDASAVRRTVTLRVYQWLGLPAARAVHVALYVNNQYVGLYAVVEPVVSAVARYESANRRAVGRLYRYTPAVPYRFDDPGTDLNGYRDLFRPEPDVPDVRIDDYAAIDEMVRAAGGDLSDQAQLSEYLDLRQLMKTAAVQTFLGVPAGVAGAAGMNEFCLHVPPGRCPIQIIPNGETFGLVDARYPIDEGLSGNALMRQASKIQSLHKVYVDSLLACAAMADVSNRRVGFVSSLQAEIERQQRVIADAVRADRFRAFTDAEFREASAAVADFADERPPFVRCRVEALLKHTDSCAARVTAKGEPGRTRAGRAGWGRWGR